DYYCYSTDNYNYHRVFF
nr:immunoglobulin light chain junction region [Macaca mulatta]MOV73357.1 immunoglobulin light chain junction region [Macaca mulatta]MOV74192.1 immunoglobulin light chain junction region [Macaca mulatta]